MSREKAGQCKHVHFLEIPNEKFGQSMHVHFLGFPTPLMASLMKSLACQKKMVMHTRSFPWNSKYTILMKRPVKKCMFIFLEFQYNHLSIIAFYWH